MLAPVPACRLADALGYNIGRQLGGDLQVLAADEIDSVCKGIKSSLLGDAPDVPLSEYVPKAVEILNAKKAEKAEGMP